LTEDEFWKFYKERGYTDALEFPLHNYDSNWQATLNCGSLEEIAPPHMIWVSELGYYQVSQLHVNPVFHDFIEYNFGRFAFYFIHNFLRPRASPDLQEIIDKFWMENLASSDFVLSVHFRPGGFEYTPPEDMPQLIHCIRTITNFLDTNNWKIFLAAETEDLVAYLQNGLSIYNLTDRIVHFNYGPGERIQDGHPYLAVIDFELLKRGHAFVGNRQSTFAIAAHSSSLLVPFVWGWDCMYKACAAQNELRGGLDTCRRSSHSQRSIERQPIHSGYPFGYDRHTFCGDRTNQLFLADSMIAYSD